MAELSLFNNFCECFEDGIQSLANSIISRANSALRNQTRKSRILQTYPAIRLPEAQLLDIFDQLTTIEESIQASIVNKIPRDVQTPAAVFLECLQRKINDLICNFLKQYDPNGLICGYGDLHSGLGIRPLITEFNARVSVVINLCDGGDVFSYQASVTSALSAANIDPTGTFNISSATNGILSSNYKDLFDGSVQSVQRSFDIRDAIETFVDL